VPNDKMCFHSDCGTYTEALAINGDANRAKKDAMCMGTVTDRVVGRKVRGSIG
jgi:hypothetical protein